MAEDAELLRMLRLEALGRPDEPSEEDPSWQTS